MCRVVPLVFHMIHFPHEGKIFMIDQLYYYILSTKTPNASIFVPFIEDNLVAYQNVGARLFKILSLIDLFRLPPLKFLLLL